MKLTKIWIDRLSLVYFIFCIIGSYGTWGYIQHHDLLNIPLGRVYMVMLVAFCIIGSILAWERFGIEYAVHDSLHSGTIFMEHAKNFRFALGRRKSSPMLLFGMILYVAYLIPVIPETPKDIVFLLSLIMMAIGGVATVVLAVMTCIWSIRHRSERDTLVPFDFADTLESLIGATAPSIEYCTVQEIYQTLKEGAK